MAAPTHSPRPTQPGTGKPHECPTCGRRVKDARSLRQHIKAAHPIPTDAMTPDRVARNLQRARAL